MKLLDFLLEQDGLGADAEKIERAAWDTFGAKVAVLNIDSVGFSRTTKSHGIVHFLTRMASSCLYDFRSKRNGCDLIRIPRR